MPRKPDWPDSRPGWDNPNDDGWGVRFLNKK